MASTLYHVFKNIVLVLISLVFLPLDTVIVLALHVRNQLSKMGHPSDGTANSQQKTILVTGVNMAKGLSLARMFHRAGHRVIGADAHPFSSGRMSSAVNVYYRLPKPSQNPSDNDDYVAQLVSIASVEKVDLWISVSDVNAAIADALVKEQMERHTNARAVQLSVKDIKTLHEKDSFIDHARSLGLAVPETQAVRSRDEIISYLREHKALEPRTDGKQYLVKPIGVNDASRMDMPILPFETEEQTIQRVKSLPTVDSEEPAYIVQEFIEGEEYCTHALIVRGQVRAFVACPSASVLMYYSALPPISLASEEMLRFTETVAEAGGEAFTGHASFDFLIRPSVHADEKKKKRSKLDIFPIECNPRVHTATILFSDTPALVNEYLSVLAPETTSDTLSPSQGHSMSPPKSVYGHAPISPLGPSDYFWVAQDLVESVLLPLYQLAVTREIGPHTCVLEIQRFLARLFSARDGTFEAWDPWPWWWSLHVYWPAVFIRALVLGEKWEKINVSTGKVFCSE